MTDWTEVRVPVPWGYVAAKTRGNISEEPMICVHGDVDNAASFDYLLPILPQKYYYICIDLPGHGMSSHYGPGIPYKLIDYVFVLKRIVDHFKWSKVNVLGHQTGGLLGLYFASCFNDVVEKLIVIDAIVVESRMPFNQYLSNMSNKLLQTEYQSQKSDYRSLCKQIQTWRPYPWSSQAEQLLMARNLVALENGYKLAIDPRVSFMHHLPNEKRHFLTLLSPMKCELLLIMSKGVVNDKIAFPVKSVINTFRKNCKRVEYYLLDDINDLHINKPKIVSEIFHQFLECRKSSL